MSPFSIPQHKWQPAHLAQALINARKVLQPHAEKFTTPAGQFATMIVSSAALLLVDDFQSRADVEATIRLASRMFDIPEVALNAFGEMIFATAMTASVAIARAGNDTKSGSH